MLIMSSYRVLDEKFTKPSNLSRNLMFLKKKFFEEVLPVAREIESNNLSINIEFQSSSYKRKICASHSHTMARKKEDSLCEVFKKLRLDTVDPEQSVVTRVNHCNACNNTNGDCCTRKNNFAGASKSFEVSKENLIFSKIPVPYKPKVYTPPTPSKIPVRLPCGVVNRNKSVDKDVLIKKESLNSKGRKDVHVSELKKSCIKSPNRTSPYINDIMDAFPKQSTKNVSFSEYIEDSEGQILMLEKDNRNKRKVLYRQTVNRDRLSLPPWRY